MKTIVITIFSILLFIISLIIGFFDVEYSSNLIIQIHNIISKYDFPSFIIILLMLITLILLSVIHFNTLNKRVSNLTTHYIITEVIGFISMLLYFGLAFSGLYENPLLLGTFAIFISSLIYYFVIYLVKILNQSEKPVVAYVTFFITLVQLILLIKGFYFTEVILIKSFLSFAILLRTLLSFVLNALISVLLIIVLEHFITFLKSLETNDYESASLISKKILKNTSVYLIIIVGGNLIYNIVCQLLFLLDHMAFSIRVDIPYETIIALIVLNILNKFLLNAKGIKEENDLTI